MTLHNQFKLLIMSCIIRDVLIPKVEFFVMDVVLKLFSITVRFIQNMSQYSEKSYKYFYMKTMLD